MAKQTVKQRKALRSEAAKKPRRVRKQLGNGMSMLVERAEAEKPREMYAADIGYWTGKPSARRFVWVPKPSLWQRIKGWLA